MTATLSHAPVDEPSASSPRSRLLLVLAAVLVVVTVSAAVLVGVERPPSLPTLADQTEPAPSAAVAWSHWVGDQTCVEVATTDGEVRRVWCDRHGAEVVGWTEDGDLLLQSWETPGRLRTVDPASGEVTGRSIGHPDELAGERGLGEDAWAEREGTELVLFGADGNELWRVASPDRYEITSAARSVDGDWLAVVDSAGRLLVLPADGSIAPRVWATDVGGWTQPVWEGTPLQEAG